MITWKLLAVAFGATTVALATLLAWQLVERARLRRRFAGVFDLERELAARRDTVHRQLAAQAVQAERAQGMAMQKLADTLHTTRDLRAHYATSKLAYDRLRAELATLERRSEDCALGLYEPALARAGSDDDQRRLIAARAQQTAAVREAQAVTYNPAWKIGGSRRAGARIQTLCVKLMLRAFNAACDAAVGEIASTGAARTIDRVEHAFAAINRAGHEVQVAITARYRELKLDELALHYELALQRHDLREHRAPVLEALRAQQALARARAVAEDDQQRAQRALDQARDQLASLQGDALDDQLANIAAIQAELRAAQQRKAEVLARARSLRGDAIAGATSRLAHDVGLGLSPAVDDLDAFPSSLPDGSSDRISM